MKNGDISKIRQNIWQFNKQRNILQNTLLQIKNMQPYSLIERYVYKGKFVKKDARKNLVGPYYFLTYLEGGKKIHKYIKKEMIEKIGKGVSNYRKFQRGLTQLRILNQEIINLFMKYRQQQIKQWK